MSNKRLGMIKKALVSSFNKVKSVRSLQVLIFASVATAMVFALSAAAGTRIYLTTSNTDLSVGESFSVDVLLDTDGENINAAGVKIDFDSSKVEFVSVDNSSTDFGTLVSDVVTGDGYVKYSTAKSPPALNGSSLKIITATFKVIDTGSISFDINNTDTEAISVDGYVPSVSIRQGLNINVPEPDPVCEDESATNTGQPLPCTYPEPDPVCEDNSATNTGQPLPCTYPEPVCEDDNATNTGQALPCMYPAPVPPEDTTVYLSPASADVDLGSNVSYDVLINTNGEGINAASVKISYNPAILEFVSFSNSAFDTTVSEDVTDRTAAYFAGNKDALNGDSVKIVRATFKAISTGTATLDINNEDTEAISVGSYMPSVAYRNGATVTVKNTNTDSTTVKLCEDSNAINTGKSLPCRYKQTTGDTGSNNSGDDTSGDLQNQVIESSDKAIDTFNWEIVNDTQNLSKNPKVKETITGVNAPKVTGIDISNVGFRRATISWDNNKNSETIVRFGTDKENLGTKFKVDGNKNSYKIDKSYLRPGKTYYFQIESTDENGEQYKSTVYSFVTKGYRFRAFVVDKKGNPIKGILVWLNSETRTSSTDENGVAEFDNVAPGSHTVSFSYEGEEYSQPVDVKDTLGIDDENSEVDPDTNSGDAQDITITVASSIGSNSNNIALVFGSILVAILAIGAVVFVILKKRNTKSFNSYIGTNESTDNSSKINPQDKNNSL